MILSGFAPVFFVGFAGGLAAELVGLFELRTANPDKFPRYVRYWYYWLLTFAMAALGGLLAVAYGVQNVKALLALNIGASAPLFLKSLARTVPTADQ